MTVPPRACTQRRGVHGTTKPAKAVFEFPSGAVAARRRTCRRSTRRATQIALRLAHGAAGDAMSCALHRTTAASFAPLFDNCVAEGAAPPSPLALMRKRRPRCAPPRSTNRKLAQQHRCLCSQAPDIAVTPNDRATIATGGWYRVMWAAKRLQASRRVLAGHSGNGLADRSTASGFAAADQAAIATTVMPVARTACGQAAKTTDSTRFAADSAFVTFALTGLVQQSRMRCRPRQPYKSRRP